MATTTVIPGNVYITTGTVSGDTITHAANKAVEIHAIKIDYDIQNPVSGIPITISKGFRSTKDVTNRVVDLKLITASITIAGSLADDATESANTKRDNLISMVKTEGGLKLLWGPSGNYRTIFGNTNIDKVFTTKVTFTEFTGIVGEAVTGDPQPFRRIDVQISFLIGKDL